MAGLLSAGVALLAPGLVDHHGDGIREIDAAAARHHRQAQALFRRELGHVAEGVMTAREVALRAASLGVDMPITAAVCAVLDGRLDARAAGDALMNRDPKAE